jgi:phosphatidylserine/phosphatidylglycerophosphate/cardiolipin synthase-like enzyme
MSKFLNGSGVQSALTDIITNAEKELFIVSPYLKIPIQTKSYLKSTDKKNIPIKIIYRTDFTVNDDDLNFFKELNNLELHHCDNLHSKCYINEKEGLVTSMNLHEHSQTHNWEMGIKYSKQIDFEIYSDTRKELATLLSLSPRHILQKKAQSTKQNYQSNSSQKPAYKPKEAPNKGIFTKLVDSVIGEEAYCIRCGELMDKFNLEKPLCDKHYASWAKYKDIKYKEKVCHACGQEKSNISYEKPICRDCFNRLYK